MPLVHFTDSFGQAWEVLEVRPSSTFEHAVTAGRESGWLAFTRENDRRRLAPIPDRWHELDDSALDALCRAARKIEPTRKPDFGEKRQPRLARPRLDEREPGMVRVVPAPALVPVRVPEEIKALVREAAQSARSTGETVVAGLLILRKVLAAKQIAADSETFRAARQLFLEIFYFRG